MTNTSERGLPHRQITSYADGKVKSFDAHDRKDLHPRSLHPRTLIDIDGASHFTVKKFDGYESSEANLLDLLEITRGHHARLVCGFIRSGVEDGLYIYDVWSPEEKVGRIWGEDLHRFDLIIARLFHPDPEIIALTQKSGMDKTVEKLIRKAALHIQSNK